MIIIKFMFTFEKSYLDGLMSACPSLEGNADMDSIDAVSQEVPLGTAL